MNKDTVVASIIGFGLGLIAAIALWVVPKMLPKTTSTTAKAQNEQVASAAPSTTTPNNAFTVTSPKDGEIVTQKSTKVEGVAADSTLVIVSTASSSAVLSPNAQGSFSTTLNLVDGANEIIVSRFLSGQEENKKVTVYFYPEDI